MRIQSLLLDMKNDESMVKFSFYKHIASLSLYMYCNFKLLAIFVKYFGTSPPPNPIHPRIFFFFFLISINVMYMMYLKLKFSLFNKSVNNKN